MPQRIDISVSEQVLAANAEKSDRLRKTRRFEPTDRVPAVINFNQWGLLEARGRTPGDYVSGPEDNLREQLLNIKWRIENVRDDSPIPTERLTVSPDLGCLRGTEFEMQVVWNDDQPPKCVHPLKEPEQIDRLEVPDPASGLNAVRIEWHHAMRRAARDFDVRLNGKPLKINVTLAQPGGPVPAAFALAGANMLLWMATEPERIHRLMRIVTDSHLRCIRFFDEMLGRDAAHPVGIGFDASEMISPQMFREFVVPYCLDIWQAYPGPRSFHHCGKNEHLLDIYRDELGVSSHNGFGACVDPKVLAEKMAGRVVLTGGPDPWLVKAGPLQQIVEDSRRYIQTLGRRGGFILSTGGGVPPGTSLQNCHALADASRLAA